MYMWQSRVELEHCSVTYFDCTFHIHVCIYTHTHTHTLTHTHTHTHTYTCTHAHTPHTHTHTHPPTPHTHTHTHTHTHIPSHTTHLPHVPHDSIFLCINEALKHHSDRHINVIIVNILPQVHPGMGLSYADDGLYVAHCNWNTTSPLGEELHEIVCE